MPLKQAALFTRNLWLEPLTTAHAEAMFEVLSEAALYRYLDYEPPLSVAYLRGVYQRLEARHSPDGNELWLNWVLKPGVEPDVSSPLIGFVQATVLPESRIAWVAYVLCSAQWGKGYAHEATEAMMQHLRSEYGVNQFLASVEAENARSIALLTRLSFEPATPALHRQHEMGPSERLYIKRM